VSEASSSRTGIQRLVRLRLRLTIWYVATFGLIILLLGTSLFAVIRYQISQQLDDSLTSATEELVRAARIREAEAKSARGRVMDAVDELNIPDRALYLLDTLGNPIKPDTAAEWIRAAARGAAKTGQKNVQIDTPHDETLRLHALLFKLASGQHLVAVAVADQVELEDRYADLIAAFGGQEEAARLAAVERRRAKRQQNRLARGRRGFGLRAEGRLGDCVHGMGHGATPSAPPRKRSPAVEPGSPLTSSQRPSMTSKRIMGAQ